MVGLPDGKKKIEDMYNRLDTIPTCDRRTYGRTDRRTSCHGIVCTMHSRRAVKMIHMRDTWSERCSIQQKTADVGSLDHTETNMLRSDQSV